MLIRAPVKRLGKGQNRCLSRHKQEGGEDTNESFDINHSGHIGPAHRGNRPCHDKGQEVRQGMRRMCGRMRRLRGFLYVSWKP